MKSLNIVHVDTQTTWRGGQRQVIELIRGLNSRGHHNTLVCKRGSVVAQKAEELGVEMFYLPLRGEWDVLSALKLRSFIKGMQVDVLHTHTSHAHTIGLMAVLGLNSCKLVVSRRVDFHVNNIFSQTFKYGNRVDKIITVSDAIRRILIEDGIDQDRLVTIRSGFVPHEFAEGGKTTDLRRKYDIGDDTIVISTVAALAPHKAHGILLKAAAKVVMKHRNVKFIFAGEGETRESVERDIKNLGIGDYIVLLGFIEDVRSVYEASDIFALSSEEEGLCTSILDAMYFSLPVVATSAGGIPELVRDGVNGFIVPVNDYLSFADRLNMLIEDKNKRIKMGYRSSDIIAENTVERTIDKTLAVYRELTD